MGKLIKGYKVILLTTEGYEAGLQQQEVGWQTTNEPDIRDGLLVIRNGINTYVLPVRRIHSLSIEAVNAE